MRLARLAPAVLVAVAACRPAPAGRAAMTGVRSEVRLPTGALLDPAGPSIDVGNMPLAMLAAPEGNRVVLLLSGWREQGLQVVDLASRRVTQTVPQPAAFLGLAFSSDGSVLFASGGNDDAIYRYAWSRGEATLIDRVPLAPAPPEKGEAASYPAGLALSPDGRRLYVAENVADDLAVVDLGSGRVTQRLPTGRYPYGVVVSPRGTVYVSAWGGDAVSVFAPGGTATLVESSRIAVGRHPSALRLNAEGTRLYVAEAGIDRVAVVDTQSGSVISRLADPPPAGPDEGSTPNGLALDPRGTRLYVAEADNNAVAVFDLSRATSGNSSAGDRDLLAGRIPAGWYPVDLLVHGDFLLALNGKGRGAGPNPNGKHPGVKADPNAYTLGQLNGTVSLLPISAGSGELAALSRRVAAANGWDRRPASKPRYPPFEHVVYIVKENRTYDQVFGDVAGGDGDPSLLYFSRDVAPNHRALAERFGLFDRFFCNAEVSSQGHPWSMSAYVTDYTEKTVQSSYSHRRPEVEEGEADEPATGFLWDLAARNGLWLRDYGEYADAKKQPDGGIRYESAKAGLAPFVHPDYPSFDMAIADQRRADVWIAELAVFVRQGRMPALEIVHLPSDHTAGLRAGMRTPKACMADNDLALGRMIQALSETPFWRTSVVFVVEDDAQDGPDHVDSHRAPFFVLSPFNRPGPIHRFVNTTDVVATIEGILKLPSLSQFDYFGRPLTEVFATKPDPGPYRSVTPSQPLTELNPSHGRGARESRTLDLAHADASDDALFNRILWRALKGGDAAYPDRRRLSALESLRPK